MYGPAIRVELALDHNITQKYITMYGSWIDLITMKVLRFDNGYWNFNMQVKDDQVQMF